MQLITQALIKACNDVDSFARHILKRPLRSYQAAFARAVVSSILARDGEQFVLRLPRQSGKNETLAIVQAYILFLYQRAGGSMIHTAPTYDVQAKNAQARLVNLIADNPFFKDLRAAANLVIFGKCSIAFVSGAERAVPLVGLTASLALFKDEAQDLDETYIQRAFDPMTLSTNATHIHTGTARHSGTYLARKRAALERQTNRDHKPRVFISNWRDVATEVPAYGQAAQATIERLGQNHPAVRTELENIEDDATGRLFDERRVALIFSGHQQRHTQPDEFARYVVTIDVGGSSLDGQMREHDSTVIAIHQIERHPHGLHYVTRDYRVFTGEDIIATHTPAHAIALAYIARWQPVQIIVDATGLGVGFASALIAKFGEERTSPVTLTESSKTKLLNGFLALVETNRYQHYSQPAQGQLDEDAARLMAQLQKCDHDQRGTYTHYSVPSDATWIHPITLERQDLHDDHLMSVILLGHAFDNPAQFADYFDAQVQPAQAPIRRHGKF